MNESWSFGAKIALYVGAPFVGLMLMMAAYALAARSKSEFSYKRAEAGAFAVGCIAAALVALGAAAVAMYPYSAEYHKWSTVEGEVAKIERRRLNETDRYVVLFTDGRVRSCDDTRCSLYHPGATLRLTCKREWQYSGDDGWSCNYIGGSVDRLSSSSADGSVA